MELMALFGFIIKTSNGHTYNSGFGDGCITSYETTPKLRAGTVAGETCASTIPCGLYTCGAKRGEDRRRKCISRQQEKCMFNWKTGNQQKVNPAQCKKAAKKDEINATTTPLPKCLHKGKH